MKSISDGTDGVGGSGGTFPTLLTISPNTLTSLLLNLNILGILD
jgi:hypothetical protein